VFIINCEHRHDRRKNITKQLQKVGVTNYEFFKAIQPTEEDMKNWNANFLQPIPKWFQGKGDETKYRLGSLGCMLSHIEIMKLARERKYKQILILEDDTEFLLPQGIKLENVFTVLKNQVDKINNYALIYLAGNHRGSKLDKITPNLYKVKGTLTTGSYIINELGMKYVLKHIKGCEREIDVFYANKMQNDMLCYCIMPHLTRQADGYSDIVQQNVSYNLG